MNTWSFTGYWNTVLGEERTPELAVREYGFEDQRAIRDWLAASEAEALRVGGIERPASWDTYSEMAFAKLSAVGAD